MRGGVNLRFSVEFLPPPPAARLQRLRAMPRASDAGAALWAALRELTDAEIAQIEQKLAQMHVFHARSSDQPMVTIRMPTSETAPRQWTPEEFTDALLERIHALAHDQSEGDSGDKMDKDGVVRSEGSALEPAKSMTPTAAASDAFSLQQDDFPVLMQATRIAPAAPIGAHKLTPKRRITTTLVTDDASYAVALKAQSASTQPTSSHADVWAKRDLLERRMLNGGNGRPPEAHKKAVVNAVKPMTVAIEARHLTVRHVPKPEHEKLAVVKPTASQLMAKPATSQLMVKPKLPKRVTPAAPSKGTDVESGSAASSDAQLLAELPRPNLQAARLYGFLLGQAFVPNTCKELRLLVSLLFRPSCVKIASAGGCACEGLNDFCHTDSCVAFATKALEAASPVLSRLGTSMLHLLLETLAHRRVCEDVGNHLRDELREREERRVEESAKIGCQLPVEAKVAAFRDFTLPFCEEVDSRLHYRTPVESVIYSNREKIRDSFLSQLRSYQRHQHGHFGEEHDSAMASAADDSKALLREVLPQNLWWFAKFFVLELVQVGSNPFGESDKEVVQKIMEDKMVVKNPDRLRKLHRRFTIQKSPEPLVPNGRKVPEKKGNTSPGKMERPSKAAASTNGDQKQSESIVQVVERMRAFFGENQLFFFHFLNSCDSYQFSELVKRQLEGQFASIWTAKPKTDPRKEFTEAVLKLKVLAKFMGYLRFSPQWHWATLAPLASINPALQAAQKDAVTTLELPQFPQRIDICDLLQESILAARVSLCVPWLCDFLGMLSSDRVSSLTKYFQRTFRLLDCLHGSSRLAALGDTGLFVAMQIEKLFEVTNAAEFVDFSDQASLQQEFSGDVLLALDDQSPKTLGLDHLPFLCSKVFVEVCVTDFEDLRGYIQTLTKPLHRSNSSTRRPFMSSGIPGSPAIRKVRPVQVLKHDNAVLGAFAAPSSDSSFQSHLSDALFKIHPQLKKSAEFVVDTVVTNVCDQMLVDHVRPQADALVDSCLRDARGAAPFTQLILHDFQSRLDERVEDTMRFIVADVLRDARALCEQRVAASLEPLFPSSMHPTLRIAASKTAIVQAQTSITSLVTKSLQAEFIKRIAHKRRVLMKDAASAPQVTTRQHQSSEEQGHGQHIPRTPHSAESGDTTTILQSLHISVASVCRMSRVSSQQDEQTIESCVRVIIDTISKMCICSVQDKNRRELARHLAVFVKYKLWQVVMAMVRLFGSICVNMLDTSRASKECQDADKMLISHVGELLRFVACIDFEREGDASRTWFVSLCRAVGDATRTIATSATSASKQSPLLDAVLDSCVAMAALTQSIAQPHRAVDLSDWHADILPEAANCA